MKEDGTNLIAQLIGGQSQGDPILQQLPKDRKKNYVVPVSRLKTLMLFIIYTVCHKRYRGAIGMETVFLALAEILINQVAESDPNVVDIVRPEQGVLVAAGGVI
ncbi:unnamed protein product, partial [Ilex paraguariensis]